MTKRKFKFSAKVPKEFNRNPEKAFAWFMKQLEKEKGNTVAIVELVEIFKECLEEVKKQNAIWNKAKRMEMSKL